ncbi:MAG: nuclear transport factor 2 family protein [Hyphomicrobiales bacterium]
MARDLIGLVNRYHAALNARDLDAVAAMFADGAEYHSPSVGGILGKHAIMVAMRGYFAEYPDQVAIDDRTCYAGPDAVRSEWRLGATSKSTGKRIERKGAETIFFSAGGMIRRVEVADAE